MPPKYEFHLFICQNQRPDGGMRGCCMAKGAERLLNYAKSRIKELGIPSARVSKAGCLNECERGVALVIYPEGVWYTISSEQDIEEIIQSHIINKQPLAKLLMK
jgi:(2Fe-2S) ferredoxin